MTSNFYETANKIVTTNFNEKDIKILTINFYKKKTANFYNYLSKFLSNLIIFIT